MKWREVYSWRHKVWDVAALMRSLADQGYTHGGAVRYCREVWGLVVAGHDELFDDPDQDADDLSFMAGEFLPPQRLRLARRRMIEAGRWTPKPRPLSSHPDVDQCILELLRDGKPVPKLALPNFDRQLVMRRGQRLRERGLIRFDRIEGWKLA